MLHDLFRLIFPELCCHCGEALVGSERHLCTTCLSKIPWTNNASIPNNGTETRLIGRIPLQAGASLMMFQKGNVTQSIIHQIKYRGSTHMARQYGLILGKKLMESGRFNNIDYIVPVPLHWWRKLRRGFNQSQLIAKAISEAMHVPLSASNLYRHRYTPSQTHKTRQQRTDNVASAFRLRHPDQYTGKHILLIDDVITTGATTEACYHALQSATDIRVSIASLALVAQ